ncbi:exodeoxyribonuclease VII large subunit [Butyrivibrio sp. MC2013]|uniref:exodeoxyribonuclease VII large subunit n=1 Tax=Butyrivibrio sp. MC2013 TaxID=1280686 RepID=UPI000406AF07|nr:exodeoxyribonuclease VII large subunit [Butyrivibrio sp. MC2013]
MSKNLYTVGQVNQYIKDMMQQDFLLQRIGVKGEISGCKYHSSGHIYFTLKDHEGVINCVMFKGNRGGLSFVLKEGMQVVVTGSVDVYVKGGSYQLYARTIRQDGAGALYEKFEALKKELKESGMFEQEYKRPIPKYIRTLGVVTAPTGAAIRDIINITRRRNPYVQIILYPALVQGDGAAESVAMGIRTLADMGVDVIIAGRGGGSIEDLWAFNEEIVAHAIFDCPVPVVSAVGHETDTTIADYVADLRAPTPSAAAELCVYEYDRLMADMEDYMNILMGSLERKITSSRHELRELTRMLMALSPSGRIRDRRMRSVDLENRLTMLWKQKLLVTGRRLDVLIEQMKGLSPLDRLKSGFSYVEDVNGRNVRSIKEVNVGDQITIHVTDGSIKAGISSIVPAADEDL